MEALGTPLSRTYTSNNLNQYTETTAGSDTWNNLHDDDGNLIQSPDTTGKLIRYSWNGENRLIATQPAVPQAGDKRLEFTYDHQGRRIAKKTLHYDGSEWELEETRKFVYKGWSMVEEVIEDGVGAVANTKTYQWGLDLAGSLTATGNVGALLSCHDPAASQTYFYTYDANGNVSTLTDTTGTLAAAYDYSPFGNLIAKTGSYSDNNRFQFSTKYRDEETNLLYYGYRYLDPKDGRWLSRDPINENGGIGLYNFIRNNRFGGFDVLGLCECCSHWENFVQEAYDKANDAIRVWEQVLERTEKTWEELLDLREKLEEAKKERDKVCDSFSLDFNSARRFLGKAAGLGVSLGLEGYNQGMCIAAELRVDNYESSVSNQEYIYYLLEQLLRRKKYEAREWISVYEVGYEIYSRCLDQNGCSGGLSEAVFPAL